MLDTKTNASQLATDGAAVYWAEDDAMVATCGLCPPPPAPKPTDSTVYRLPVSGGTPTALATGYRIDAAATDGAAVYWIDGFAQTLSTVPISGGTPTVLAEKVTTALWPVVDATAIYWVSTTGEVMRMPKSPG
jgi:hypothetical protein